MARVPSEPPVPLATARSQFFTCIGRMRLAAQLPHRFEHLRQSAAIGGMVGAEPAPSVLNGSLPTPAIRLPSETTCRPGLSRRSRGPRSA